LGTIPTADLMAANSWAAWPLASLMGAVFKRDMIFLLDEVSAVAGAGLPLVRVAHGRTVGFQDEIMNA
jgi:hypothetical protein